MRLLLSNAMRKDLLYAADLHGDIGGGKPGDIRYRRGVHFLQIRDDDLPVQRSELHDDLLNVAQGSFAIDVTRLVDALERSFDLLETHKVRVDAPFADDVGGRYVVGHTERPGLEGASSI